MASLLRTAETLQRALAAELSGGAEVPWRTKLKLWRAGFKSASYALFGLEHNDPRDYVSDLEVARASRINGALGRVLKDKLLFASLFAPYAAVPEVYGVIERGQVYPLSRPELRDVGALLELSAKHPLILKPARGNKGRGVLSLRTEGGALHLSGQAVTPNEVADSVGALDGYLIVARVQQHAYADTIFAAATNTIRIITLKDPDTGEVFIPAAVHRFGTALTAPTDNFQTGGLSAAIDVATGQLGRAAQFPTFTGGELRWLERHPDTGAQLSGVQISRWDEVKKTVTGLIGAFPFLRYVGWDVVVTEAGVVIIEGNHNINLGVQVHGPLLKDARTRRFFEHHKVLRPR